MKYAMVNDAKSEARKGLIGLCPNCKSPMIPKCGEKKIHHWSHKGKLECDHWWEPETIWHRNWKNNFPKEWQEVVHQDPDTGERHIADVKTSAGIILEFQHSPIKPEERKARNDFYKKIVWVVDGLRLKSDLKKVVEALKSGKPVNQFVLKLNPEACSLFKEWASPNVPVFFDFGRSQLVLLLPIGQDGFYYATTAISREQFIIIFKEPESKASVEFLTFLRDWNQIVYQWNNPRPVQNISLIQPQRRYSRRGPLIDYLQNRPRYRNRRR